MLCSRALQPPLCHTSAPTLSTPTPYRPHTHTHTLVTLFLFSTGVTVSKALPKPRVALTVSGGRCNVGMPTNVFDRFLWVIKMYAQAGFKIVIDNHVWLEDSTGESGRKV